MVRSLQAYGGCINLGSLTLRVRAQFVSLFTANESGRTGHSWTSVAPRSGATKKIMLAGCQVYFGVSPLRALPCSGDSLTGRSLGFCGRGIV